MLETYKDILGLIATIITFAAFFPYMYTIVRGKTRPHFFSFIIFGLTTFMIFLGQLADGGGAGAWPIGFSGLITFCVAFLAWLKRADMTITRSDWVFFLIALSAIPLWIITSDPMWSVLLLVGMDVFGMIPTMRKAYHRPHEDKAWFFSVILVRNVISAFALENYSVTTLAFPVAVSAACFIIVAVLITSRARLAISS